ncbi:MAG: MAPEG family protein [Rhizobiaceae bacterium]|jgi:hypothetical protein
MNETAILWPLLAQVALTYVVYAVLGYRRREAVLRHGASPDNFRLRTTEPESSATVANNLSNQYELPVLFYVVCLGLYVTQGVSAVTLLLAWLFVLARIAHAFIHLTSNRVSRRGLAFAVGYVLLGVLWLWFALHVAGAV